MSASTVEELVTVDDNLRPQSTFGYKKGWAAQPFDFPNLYIQEPFFPVKNWQPIDTYADDHNIRFEQRYGQQLK
jgi:hypothetical protein